MRRLLVTATVFAALWTLALLWPASAPGSRRGDSVTFSNQVVRVFQNNCQTCHHPGDIAPFSLMTYEDAAPYANSIKARTSAREMPPWKPTASCELLVGERRLSDAEIATIAAWVDAGAPEGDPADLPDPIEFPDGWKLGTPDAEWKSAARGFTLPENQTSDIYRCFPVATNFQTDRFITGVEIRPGNRLVVHHVLVFVDAAGRSVALDNADPGPGYTSFGGVGFDPSGYLGAWAPGALPTTTPEGTGIFVPRGAHLVFQIHYSVAHGHGHGATDTTLLGVHFAREPVRKELVSVFVLNEDFQIPAGAVDHEVVASLVVPDADLTVHSVFPHMHLLGRRIQVTTSIEGAEPRCLIGIDDWDFNWQGMYRLRNPVPLPAGARLDVRGFYDNSANNPNNPNSPPRLVRYGEQTTDEMCLAIAEVTLDSQNIVPTSPVITSVRVAGSKLVVAGTDLRAGAFIEVNGTIVRDTKAKGKKASSKAAWQTAVPVGVAVAISVLNPDGARSAAMTFTR